MGGKLTQPTSFSLEFSLDCQIVQAFYSSLPNQLLGKNRVGLFLFGTFSTDPRLAFLLLSLPFLSSSLSLSLPFSSTFYPQQLSVFCQPTFYPNFRRRLTLLSRYIFLQALISACWFLPHVLFTSKPLWLVPLPLTHPLLHLPPLPPPYTITNLTRPLSFVLQKNHPLVSLFPARESH
ncbi:uncharacterized protein BO97DRAFT_240989 [Aspergillus homomorphus CBS 101889]|uniref:Uncharacterized protein n=1 Tax=Aspergillus homomorphus (strain CBS 101889) TaxID=1450537 RepID=A0A395I618_ASPHC|nr:hypothetical protein BO97DRAFT_240989 [Aspergillus homomorphus CBS 101889]RAL15245.1 hypothetical protein BO97DRAFT_240989 [Aspergillus homomorphus CBS 101889]